MILCCHRKTTGLENAGHSEAQSKGLEKDSQRLGRRLQRLQRKDGIRQARPRTQTKIREGGTLRQKLPMRTQLVIFV